MELLVSFSRRVVLAAVLALVTLPLLPVSAQQVDSMLFASLRWRMIGPYRGGRTVAAVGIPEQPNVFYIGVNNGGVWKSTDYGRVWRPIFDDQSTGSVGAIAIAPSDPNVIYVGSGEGLQRPDLSTGDGIYKSTDGGAHWTHLGLRDGQQIPAVIVDPRNPNRVFAAVLGHPYGPNVERGVFRSTDGGATWTKVLYKDENTGAFDVVFDPANPNTVYADLWAGRQAPWEVGSSFNGPGSGLFKSTDGGTTWRQLTTGLPSDGLGRIGFAIAPDRPARIYALVDAARAGGLYRSDDAGESWTLLNADSRLWGRGSDFAELRVDPRNADVVYDANVVTWKSTDGGRSFTALRGAPGGDDYHRLWINPNDPRTILLASDQGAIVTVNGGDTWSSWYNQPTAQFYHVTADNAFPYRLCGGQQESGSACVSSRGDDGEVTFRDWHPVGVEEYGYAAPDPLDPDIVYGGKLTRYDRRTGDVQQIAPKALRDSGYRVVRTQPAIFSPLDPHALYFASNVLWKTRDGGVHWTQISPDLTRPAPAVPSNLGSFASLDPEHGAHRGVVYTLAPSYRDVNVLWAGTDDGLIHVTTNGGASWRNVTPPALRDRPWAKISLMDASRFDAASAYAAVNTFRLDDLHPHIFRTHDGGATWKEIVTGLPDGAIVNVVREDPGRRGLLYAGTERAVYVSFDDGDHWQSLRLNMPATSIRDLIVKDDDIAVATHGRSFWILDDVTPLRQFTGGTTATDVVLFAPQRSTRVRWNKYTDTPIPPDESAGENPPDGAILDYYLDSPADVVTLEILSPSGQLVRRFRSTDPAEAPVPDRNIPDYWIRPQQRLSGTNGMHRFVWDLHYPTPAAPHFEYPISATYMNTPAEPRGPWASPGTYTVRLSANGRTVSQPLVVRMDPRVRVAPAALARQFVLATQLAQALDRVASARRTVATRDTTTTPATPGTTATPGAGRTPPADRASLGRLAGELADLYAIVEGSDAPPTPQTEAAIADRLRQVDSLIGARR
ncbi:MAG TPA: glycosyl hydrolase [Gemmatimonadaceae bacterium]